MMRVATWLVPAAEILTVGLPFCAFKMLTGLIVLPTSRPLGVGLIAFGAIDLALNVTNLVAFIAAHRRVCGACTLEIIVRRVRPSDDAELGLAIDVFISFALVAAVVGFGLLPQLPPWASLPWSISVVLNVLGAGVGRLVTALRSQSTE